LALGEIGLEIDQFYYLTPREFYNLLRGYRKKEFDKEKIQWDRVRLQIYYSVLPYSKDKKLSPMDVLTFPWEEQAHARRKPKTRAELEQLFNSKKKK
jgi:hypothetical protein